MKKIISFSLWGQNPKYLVGALRNAELAASIYEDWICRYYIGTSVPRGLEFELEAFPNVEIVRRAEFGDWRGMYWRFEPASEDDVEVMISRDTDSRLSLREKAAVDAWLASDKGFHIMRDHPHHKFPVLGGMWGVKAGVLPRMKAMINEYSQQDEYGTDYKFFAEAVLPILNETTIMTHDEFFGGRQFPTPRDGWEFVGQVFDENEKTPEEHQDALKRHMQTQVQMISGFTADENYISNTLLVQHHMGLGDHICLNGLVRYALSDVGFEKVVLFCKHPYEKMVTQMYSDDARISVVSVGKVDSVVEEAKSVIEYIKKLNHPCVYLRLGFENYQAAQAENPNYSCDKCFYEMANVPYQVRWSHFKFERDEAEEDRVYKKLNPNDKSYVFVHDDPARGYEIFLNKDKLGDRIIIKNDISESLFSFAKILEQAQEIHCMESSFRCLLEALDPQAKRLVFYDSLRPSPGSPGTKFDWEFV